MASRRQEAQATWNGGKSQTLPYNRVAGLGPEASVQRTETVVAIRSADTSPPMQAQRQAARVMASLVGKLDSAGSG